jgi:hypothetical protein
VKSLMTNIRHKIAGYANALIQEIETKNTLPMIEIGNLHDTKKAHHTLLKTYVSIIAE